MTHTMIDLETMGGGAGAAIASLGAVEFDPKEGTIGRELYFAIDLQSCLAVGLRVDGPTIYWWLKQSEAARAALMDRPVPLHVALQAFKEWLRPDSVIWAKPISFDLPILAEAYRVTGTIRPPWNFRNEMDARTLFKLTNTKPSARTDTSHNALDDAREQAKDVCRVFSSPRSWDL